MNNGGEHKADHTSLAEIFGDEPTGHESFIGHELLKRIPSWIGGDICVVGDSIIRPGEIKQIDVLIKKDHFPEVNNGGLFRGLVKGLSYSTRSCFAQSGVFVMDSWPHQVHNSILRKVNANVESIIEIPVKNAGYTHIQITDGVGMLRFFHLSGRDKARGSSLYSLIKDDGFSIEGRYDETWFLVDIYGNKLTENEHAKAENLVLILNENRYKSESRNSVEPLIIESKKDLAKILHPLGEDEEKHFVIGETPHVSLGKGVYGKIFTVPYEHDDPFPGKVTNSQHEPSPLIDENFSGPIRTEISGGNGFVEMEVFKIG